MSSRIVVLPVLQELKELLGSPLLKEPHQRTPNGLHLRAGNLGNPALTINEATGDLLELKIASNIGVNEDPGELAGCNDELGNEVNGIVAVASKLRGRALVGSELAIQLEDHRH